METFPRANLTGFPVMPLQSVAGSVAGPERAATTSTMPTTPATQPAMTPRMKRDGRCPTDAENRHSPGTYCDVVMVESTSACSAKAMSLGCTVGVSPGWRAAYWERMTGEAYRAQLD